ncbi:TPA: hypothetical protein HA270_03490 [Candidatus Woesearchaeota archaeon]|nr:hypothetical protein [Candidatus Woesearchaeota archaeon]
MVGTAAMDRKKNRIKSIAFLFILAAAFLGLSLYDMFLLQKGEQKESFSDITGESTNEGIVSLCFNARPFLGAISHQTARVGTLFLLSLSADDDNSENVSFALNDTSLFNITKTGTATAEIAFLPIQAHLGNNSELNFTILIQLNDTSGCDNNGFTRAFNLTMTNRTLPEVPGASGGGSTGGGAGGGGGGGGGGAQPVQGEPPELSFSEDLIKVMLKEGESIQKQVVLRNTGAHSAYVTLFLEGLQGAVVVNTTAFWIFAGEEKPLLLTFDAQELWPEIYLGTLTAESGGIRDTIDLILEVESASILFDASLDLAAESKTVYPLDELHATVTIFSLQGRGLSDVTVIYSIRGTTGLEYFTEQETISLGQQVSFAKVFQLPAAMEPGSYVLAVMVKKDSSVGTASERFTVMGHDELFSPLQAMDLGTLLSSGLLFLVVLILISLAIQFSRLQKGLKQKKPSLQERRKEREKERKRKETEKGLLEKKEQKLKEKEMKRKEQEQRQKRKENVLEEEERKAKEKERTKKEEERKAREEQERKQREQQEHEKRLSNEEREKLMKKLQALEKAHAGGFISRDVYKRSKKAIECRLR